MTVGEDRWLAIRVRTSSTAVRRLVVKYRLDFQCEEPGDPESQRQGRVVPAGFKGIDGLAGYVELLAKQRLRPALLRAQLPDVVFQRRPAHLVKTAAAIPYATQKTGFNQKTGRAARSEYFSR